VLWWARYVLLTLTKFYCCKLQCRLLCFIQQTYNDRLTDRNEGLYYIEPRVANVCHRFEIMCRCWSVEPTARPTFDLLVTWLDDVISGARGPAAAATDDDSRFYLNVARLYTGASHHSPHAPAPPPTDTPCEWINSALPVAVRSKRIPLNPQKYRCGFSACFTQSFILLWCSVFTFFSSYGCCSVGRCQFVLISCCLVLQGTAWNRNKNYKKIFSSPVLNCDWKHRVSCAIFVSTTPSNKCARPTDEATLRHSCNKRFKK